MGSRSRNALALLSFIVLASFGHAAFAQRGMSGTFITKNDYPDKWMWVTVYESTVFSRSIVETGCVPPGSTMNFVRPRGGGYPLGAKHYIRAEVTVRNCAHPRHCDTTITAYPSLGGQVLHLIPNGGSCYWEAKNSGLKGEPPKLQAMSPGARIVTRNGHELSMWVTVYRNEWDGRKIKESGCVPSGKERAWNADYGRTYYVRAEVTDTPDCRAKANNAHVRCDTTIQAQPSIEGQPPRRRDTEVTLLRNEANCYWRPDN